ncbi:Membrane-spanning 4-domains subfamily A member 15, partial [Ophiophagus hannah]
MNLLEGGNWHDHPCLMPLDPSASNLIVATLPASMASGTVFVIPSNGANIIQTTPGLPSVALQASGAIPYPQYGAQQLGISTTAPQQVPQGGPLERFLKAEPKVLG